MTYARFPRPFGSATERQPPKGSHRKAATERQPPTSARHSTASCSGATSLICGLTVLVAMGLGHAVSADELTLTGNGLKYSRSAYSVDETVTRIRADLETKGIRYFTTIDQGALGADAGIQTVEPVETFPPERWDLIVAVNMNSAFHTTRTALTGMKEPGWGRIINISSAPGLVGDNAAGKSTLLKILSGIIAASSGEIAIDGTPVHLRRAPDALDEWFRSSQSCQTSPGRIKITDIRIKSFRTYSDCWDVGWAPPVPKAAFFANRAGY